MRFLKWLIGLLIIVGLLLTLAPFAARWYLLNWFEDNGYQAQIKHLGLDFIFGEITLYDVHVNNAEDEGFSVFSAELDVDLLALLKGRLVIDQAIIDSARLDLRKAGDSWLLAGFRGQEWTLSLGRDDAVTIRRASLVNTELCSGYQSRCLRVESATLSDAQLERAEQGWLFSHEGSMLIQKAFLRDRSQNTTLFYGGELNIDRGRYAAGEVDIIGIRLANIQFIESELDAGAVDAPYQTQIGELSVTALNWQRGPSGIKLVLGSVEVISLRQAVQRNKQGNLLLPTGIKLWLHGVFGEQPGSHFKLEGLQVRDGAVAWADYSVSPPAMEKLSAVLLRIGSIDSAFANSSTDFALSGKLGRNGLLRFEGEVYPYREQLSFRLNGLVESLNVERLSGYTRALLDQRVDEGVVDVAIEASAEAGYLRAHTRWQWTGFDIAPARTGAPYMPLELAYDLLKDHNDSVRFTLEIAGEVGSETVQPRYIFANQTRRILSQMAKGEMTASGPVSVTADRNQRQIAFEPLLYSANARYPIEQDQQRLTELAAMLRDKPHLKMRFCPVITGQEWAQLFNRGQSPAAGMLPEPHQQKQMLDLAAARGKALRSALMDEGIAADQIVICAARVDMTQSGQSFITVTL